MLQAKRSVVRCAFTEAYAQSHLCLIADGIEFLGICLSKEYTNMKISS